MKKGFTLIELLVVILIIGILSSIALPQYARSVEKARAAEAIQLLGDLARAQKIYYMAAGTYINDMNKLDFEIPNVSENDRSLAHTNAFLFKIDTSTTDEFKAYAQRIQIGDANLTPASGEEKEYAIILEMDVDGNMTRYCRKAFGSADIPDICKSIANNQQGNIL